MNPEDQKPIEKLELRTDTTKHFELPDGQFQAEIHLVPIHYKDGSGAFRRLSKLTL